LQTSSLNVKVFGHGATLGLGPMCGPKRTSANALIRDLEALEDVTAGNRWSPAAAWHHCQSIGIGRQARQILRADNIGRSAGRSPHADAVDAGFLAGSSQRFHDKAGALTVLCRAPVRRYAKSGANDVNP
jgi:hypothetical protein